MNRFRLSFLLLLSLCLIHGRAADSGVTGNAEEDWKQFEALRKSVGPLPAPYKNFLDMPPLEQQKVFEARARLMADFALDYYAKHPQDPRRWEVLDVFVFSSAPDFVTEWGPLDESGRARRVVDEKAAAAWKSTVAKLRSDLQAASDVPEAIRQTDEARVRRQEAVRAFSERWKTNRREVAPDFSFTVSDGREMTLADLRGKIVLLDFWATWCGPCMDAMPHTQEVAARFKDQGVVALGVCVWDQRGKFDAWVKQNQTRFPDIVWGYSLASQKAGSGASQLYGFAGIPAAFIIDREGRVVDAFTGSGGLDATSRLEKAIVKAGVRIDPK